MYRWTELNRKNPLIIGAAVGAVLEVLIVAGVEQITHQLAGALVAAVVAILTLFAPIDENHPSEPPAPPVD